MKSASYQCLCVLALTLAVCCPASFAQETEKKEGPAWEIRWIKGSFSKATIVIKRFGRLQRNELWDPPPGESLGGIDYLAAEVLKLDENSFEGSPSIQKDIREMKGYAYFYRARSRGRKVDKENPSSEQLAEVKVDLGKAVEFGYTNHQDFLGSKKELHFFFDKDGEIEDPDFEALIKDLEEKAYKRIREGYPKQVSGGFALFAGAEKKIWRPELKSSGGEPFWPAESPSIVVLSRIHHDGYNKFIGRIEKLADAKSLKGALRTAFYQMRADDKARLAQTASYVKALGTTSPYCVIDRAQYKALRATLKGRYEDGSEKEGKKDAVFDIFQPVVIFFDSAGVPLYQTNGILENWQIEAVLTEFTAATSPGAPEEKAASDAKGEGEK